MRGLAGGGTAEQSRPTPAPSVGDMVRVSLAALPVMISPKLWLLLIFMYRQAQNRRCGKFA